MRKEIVSLLIGAIALSVIGCGSGEASSSKTEDATYKDRDKTHMKGPPAGFHGGGPAGGVGGPPPQAKAPDGSVPKSASGSDR